MYHSLCLDPYWKVTKNWRAKYCI